MLSTNNTAYQLGFLLRFDCERFNSIVPRSHVTTTTEPVGIGRSEESEALWHELVVRTQAGDRNAYIRLLDELSVVIDAYCNKYLGALGLADDCLQECLLALHRNLHTYNPHLNFRPWFFTILKHKVFDQLRSHQRAVGREVKDDSIVDAAISNERADARLEQTEFLAILSGLKPIYREALIMTKLKGHSVREAAEKLGISQSALKVRIHRGINELQQQMRLELFLAVIAMHQLGMIS